ncbi:arsenosugar biosynthesis radical SAM (seleno)protein ArsS [methane-oxidizing endosymbiont of Gigantopelta aegis]|uniref:arsenosugar biosynthesis radical SAM (seleno)protein ArsS n=1 Tax=methane-oxidizing endosymbiont of Gigantopelta aegis TaxID=2794938 RepID=UPI0018DDC688|nr:arsenosugar biosynthesis radical SAM (seleno)protein ArsS [methane-oxidizing endosymbiont of Gigantopelta aegis]
MRNTQALLLETDFPTIFRSTLNTLQMNLGYLCNLSCQHCHVNAGPKRTELMDKDTMKTALAVIEKYQLEILDVTGGSPEMNPHFKWLVKQARALGVKVIDRCNPTILLELGYEDLVDFLATEQVEITASLPCYLEDNVDAQRGKGVFKTSINALKKLNEAGYGKTGSDLVLNLVFNPQGPTLPPEQTSLEAAYREFLQQNFGLEFNHLFTITNMPIQRFGAVLLAKGQFENYMNVLKHAFKPENLNQVMCKTLLSVDWQGFVYDCDFNQMLDLPMAGRQRHLSDLLHHDFSGQRIETGDHCYGCTAGQGSSCTGVLQK